VVKLEKGVAQVRRVLDETDRRLAGGTIESALAPSSLPPEVATADWRAELDSMAVQTYLRVVKNQCGGLPGPPVVPVSLFRRFLNFVRPASAQRKNPFEL
jgi:hypothetical protein